jgi:hypothetical protein
MTSPATLILKLSQLTKQSEFYLSQYLHALIHLPRVWRNLHAELHLTALTVTILQLTRQLRMSSLIRIGAPPLLKLGSQKPALKSEEETQPNLAATPLDLTALQEPLAALQARALDSPNAFQAITRRLFRPELRTEQTLPSRTHGATTKEGLERVNTHAPQDGRLPTSPRLEDEGPAEESLRENIVERWLQQGEETGRRPMMSFVEAHKLYRDLFEEFVATSTLPPNLFADRFLQTPPNLTYEQARSDLRVRLNASTRTEPGSLELKDHAEATTSKPSIFLPSYITNTLWVKGSLAFGSPPLSNTIAILGQTSESSEGSKSSSTSNSSDLGEALTETFAQLGDELSRNQDRIANEAYLGTARERVSLMRHAQQPENQVKRPDLRDINPEVNSVEMQTSGLPLKKVPKAEDILNADEFVPAASSHPEHHLIPSPNQPEQNLRIYSPAAALYTTLAAHTRTAFISPKEGNGRTSPATINTSQLKPPFAIVRDLKTATSTDTSLKLSQQEEPNVERTERTLPITESHPTPLYLRPPMNLPAVESMVPQRILSSTLPSPRIAPTRENISKQDLDNDNEDDENGEAEGYPEDEDEEDAEIREQVNRIGKIIAEEARRHIGST